jgi:hypothetical protein
MNANAVTRQYGKLTPEETFRLILAAGVRGDEAERDRLVRSGGRITLSFPAHAPYGLAFEELALLTYIELLDAAAFYDLVAARATEALRDGIEHSRRHKRRRASAERGGAAGEGGPEYPAWHRLLQMEYAAGYILRAKADGWRLFCARWNDAPDLLWERMALPGLDRIRRALAAAETAAFTAAGMADWLNARRPADAPEISVANIITVEAAADEHDRAFRARVGFWGAD